MGRMINDNTLPYLDFARTTFIPEEMFNRMNRDVRLALTPRVRSSHHPSVPDPAKLTEIALSTLPI
jgi:hypothetical protein